VKGEIDMEVAVVILGMILQAAIMGLYSQPLKKGE